MRHKNRVLMLLRNEFTNDHRVKKEADSLVRAGYEVTILAELQTNRVAASETNEGIKIVRVPVFGRLSSHVRNHARALLENSIEKNSLKARLLILLKNNPLRRYLLSRRRDYVYFAKALQFAKSHCFDLVHAHDLDTLRLGVRIAQLWKVPLIYDSHELWRANEFVLRRNLLARKYWAWLEARFIKHADVVIATTESRAMVIKETYNIPKPAVVMNIPVYTEIERQNVLRERLQIPNQEKIVLYQGNLSKNRGLYQLIGAITKLENVRLVFLGTGDEMDKLKVHIAKHDLRHRVHVLPSVPLQELPANTSSADIGAATILNTCQSYYLSLPNKIFETMMAGIPLVMSDFPEYRKLADEADVGEIVDPENPDDIAEAINKLLGDPHRLERIRHNCRKLTRSKYNWKREEKKLLQIYADLLETD